MHAGVRHPATHPAARRLALVRILVYASWLAALRPAEVLHYCLYGPALSRPPGLWAHLIDHLHAAPPVVRILYAAFVPACVLAMLGVRPVLSQAVVVVAGGALLTIPQFFGKVVHHNHLLWFALVLLVSPCADAIAPDAASRPAKPAIAYRLPLLFIILLTGVAYFFPGVWKCVHVGTEWLKPSNQVGILHAKWAELGATPSLRGDRFPVFCSLAAAFVLVFELAFLPLALIGPRTRAALIACGLVFHAGVLAVMKIRLWHLAAGYAALPLRRQRAPNIPRARARLRPVVLVGSVLVVGNVIDGVLERDDWPFGLYPTFAHEAGPTMETAFLIFETPGGESTRTQWDLARHAPPERTSRTYDMLLHPPPGRSREDTARALAGVWRSLDPALAAATYVRVERVTIPTDPDVGLEPVRREVVSRVAR